MIKVKVNGKIFPSIKEFEKHYNIRDGNNKQWRKRNPGKKKREMKVKLLIEFVEE